MVKDTVAAVVTAPGEAAVALVRISGPEAVAVARRVFAPGAKGSKRSWQPESHVLYYGWVHDGASGEALDEVMAVAMLAPRSYTREDVVEISCHGGAAVVRAVLRAVLQSGARAAEPGEFTLRAFLNGRIDLSQAEAVMDLIRARTDRSRKAAAEQLAGRLGRVAREIGADLLGLVAEVEARLDFPDEDLGELLVTRIAQGAEEIRGRLQCLLATAQEGQRLQQGLKLVIAGKPNAGKSSLLNALIGRDRAIVSDRPGTTRDFVEEALQLAGYPVILTDTAGIRDTLDEIERIGTERARERIAEADVVLFVLDTGTGWTEEDAAVAALLPGRPVVAVVNKTDVSAERSADLAAQAAQVLGAGVPVVAVSARTGSGLEDLRAAVASVLEPAGGHEAEALVTSARQEDALRRADRALQAALDGLRGGWPADLVAIDLREAWQAVGEITGETATDDLISAIFGRFCIGK